MPNLSLTKEKMPQQDPDVRNKNFDEVALGYRPEQAVTEADRCLQCKTKPCVSGCPVCVDIPGFIGKVKTGDIEGAYEILSATNSLPAVCGRVCPQESQCECKCVRGNKGEPVAIGRLERYVADWHMAHKKEGTAVLPVQNGHKVAVVGAGPAGLTCAGDLARLGYKVTIFESLHAAGGVLIYGIPQFRLPKEIVNEEIDGLKAMGVEIQTNTVIGRTMTVEELFENGYEAVFIGSGAGLPTFMKIPGESLNGVYSANEFLTRINLMKAYREDSDTPVQHARRVAMDAARCAKRLGAEEVYIVYRRSEKEMPARIEEVEHAKEEGIIFRNLTNPVEILGDDKHAVCGMKCVSMDLSDPDESGRRRPVVRPNSEHLLDVDCVIMAIGKSPNPLIRNTPKDPPGNNHGCIITDDETGKTSREGVYAGGDAVTGAATVILAMGAGKQAAKAIDEYIRNK
jgi:glutamate synthase (NADPH/NADH) small chain